MAATQIDEHANPNSANTFTLAAIEWETVMMTRSLLVACALCAASLQADAQKVLDNTYYRPLAPRAPGEILDGVIDVAGDSAGHVLVADGRRGTVLILNAQLQVVGQVGRKGSGPGEYREIQAVRGTRSGFVVVDRVLRRIYTYSWSGTVPRLVKSVKLDFEPYDLCPLADGKFVVLGRRQGMRLHLIEPATGTILQSGAPFSTRVSVSLSDNLIEGRISCGGEVNRLAMTSGWIPQFDIVSLNDLKIIRTDSLESVRKMKIIDEKDRTSFSSGPQGYHSPGRAFFFEGALFMQAVTVARVDNIDDDSVLVFKRAQNGARISGWKSPCRLFPVSRDSAVAVYDDFEITLRRVGLVSATTTTSRTRGNLR